MIRRRLLYLGLGLLATAALVIGFLAAPRGPAPDERFLRHYAPFVVAADSTEPGGFRRLRLEASNGLGADVLLRVPSAPGTHAAVILQGGFRTGRNVIRHVPDALPPLVWASLDYLVRKPDVDAFPNYLQAVDRITREGEQTVAATLALLDWLEAQPFVDPGRTVIAGGSIGAFFAVVEGAIEPRFEGVAMFYGGGHLPAIVAMNVPYVPTWKRIGVEWAVNPTLGPVDPLHFAGRISPRPFLMVNGTGDERIPRRCVEDLFAAAKEPKRLVWLDHGHEVQGDEELVGELAVVVVEWMRGEGWIRSDPLDKRPER